MRAVGGPPGPGWGQPGRRRPPARQRPHHSMPSRCDQSWPKAAVETTTATVDPMTVTGRLAAGLLVLSLAGCGSSSKMLATTTTGVATSTTSAPATTAPATATARPTSTLPATTSPPRTSPTTATTALSGVSGVTAGAFCSPAGSRGTTKTGAAVVCTTTPTDSRNRWRAA